MVYTADIWNNGRDEQRPGAPNLGLSASEERGRREETHGESHLSMEL